MDNPFSTGGGNNAAGKQRIIQEFVPGKQITLAHMIANPVGNLSMKLGLAADTSPGENAIGIFTITPSEAAIIAADAATKAASITIGFVDRFSGSLLFTGDVAAVEAAIGGVIGLLCDKMGFTPPAEITRS